MSRKLALDEITGETRSPSATGVECCFVFVLLSVCIISTGFKLRIV